MRKSLKTIKFKIYLVFYIFSFAALCFQSLRYTVSHSLSLYSSSLLSVMSMVYQLNMRVVFNHYSYFLYAISSSKYTIIFFIIISGELRYLPWVIVSTYYSYIYFFHQQYIHIHQHIIFCIIIIVGQHSILTSGNVHHISFIAIIHFFIINTSTLTIVMSQNFILTLLWVLFFTHYNHTFFFVLNASTYTIIMTQLYGRQIMAAV